VLRVKKLLEDAGIRDRSVVMLFTAPDEGRKLHASLLAHASLLGMREAST
jgi:hypothetical protein